ncbi:hypothetical protein Vadar_012108 [Vaccinium darrowii]|uniref:Uncharacterized protein n=1 Tax=Vaccinium darrowii TaxID=229202 RepID=A0ACB7X041_9ERIC|nr:hypothetical protein Vadar_012108 [Vaccinium darrowii]
MEEPTDALRPIIPDNACILCFTAAAGTELADAYYSLDTVIASSPGKEVRPMGLHLAWGTRTELEEIRKQCLQLSLTMEDLPQWRTKDYNKELGGLPMSESKW